MELPTRPNIVVSPDELKNEIQLQEEKEVEDDLEASQEAADELDDTPAQMPSRFKKMTKAQLVEAYENVEREKSRLGNEVGQLRKTVDEYILKPKDEPRKSITAEDILEKPDEILQEAIRNSDYVKSLEERLNRLSSGSIEDRFNSKHPDAERVLNSSEFVEYVNSHPAAKMLASDAYQTNDYNKLGALLEDFKISTGGNIKRESQERRNRQLEDAQLESKSSSGVPKKSGLTREKIVETHVKDPELYWSPAYQAKVMEFYRSQKK